MQKKIVSTIQSLLLPTCILLTGCAGSLADYSARTSGGPSLESRLEPIIGTGSDKPELLREARQINAPVCSSTVPGSATGWSIDGGNWCVVACDKGIPRDAESRWLVGADRNRCLTTASGATELTQVELDWSDLNLEGLAVFGGFGRSFLADTQWRCEVFSYQVDPATMNGFWAQRTEDNIVYRFHADGRLVIGRTLASMKLAGSWRVDAGNQVYFNSKKVFNSAVDYGGGRFDDFQNARLKQVCRFVSEADA